MDGWDEQKGFTFTLQANIMWKPSQIAVTISLHHRTTIKALGSLESGFSHPMGLNSRLGGDLPALKLFYSQANICLCFDAAAWRGWFFRIVTLLGSWTIFPGNSGLLLLFTSWLIISIKQRLVHTLTSPLHQVGQITDEGQNLLRSETQMDILAPT